MYNSHQRKLDPRTTSGYFIGYAEKSKGYHFYYPTHTPKAVEARNAKFLENFNNSGRNTQRVVIEEMREHLDEPAFRSGSIEPSGHIPIIVQSLPIQFTPTHEDVVEDPIIQEMLLNLSYRNYNQWCK